MEKVETVGYFANFTFARLGAMQRDPVKAPREATEGRSSRMSGYPKFKTLGDSLSFEVRINGNLYLANISGEALWSHFGGGLDDAGLMAAYFANEEEIHAVAAKHIREGDLSPSLTLKDFENQEEARGCLKRAASGEAVSGAQNVSTFFRRLDQEPHLGKLAAGILDGPDALIRLMELAAAVGLPFNLQELAESGELDWFEFGLGSGRGYSRLR